jgi:hypothetical protein
LSGIAKDSLLAIVMTKDEALPSTAALNQAICRRIPEATQSPAGGGDKAILMFVDGFMLSVGKVAAPCPIQQGDPCVVSAWYWPDAWKEIGRHKAHMVVSVTGAGDPKKRSNLLAQLVAGVVEATATPVGVHWASADALWPAAIVAKTILPGDAAPPLMFCVAVKLSRDVDGRVSAITKGLNDFGLMEIETRGFAGDPRQLSGAILDLAGYLIEAGDVIKDGDTVGPDAATKITVRREESSFAPGQKVYRLYFSKKGAA